MTDGVGPTGASEGAYLVFVTGPRDGALLDLARRVVDERLAACVNVVDGLHSVYRWEGSVEEDREALALLKTTAEGLDRLRGRVLELHPYDEPEFLAVRADGGSASYLRWIRESVAASGT